MQIRMTQALGRLPPLPAFRVRIGPASGERRVTGSKHTGFLELFVSPRAINYSRGQCDGVRVLWLTVTMRGFVQGPCHSSVQIGVP